MSLVAYLGMGMVLLFILVMFGFVFFRLQAADYYSPAKQAARSAKALLKEANK